jgi:hypothetical protein
MRTGFAAVGSELGELREQFGALATQLRVLHEDVIRRIALLQEGLNGAPRRRARKK